MLQKTNLLKKHYPYGVYKFNHLVVLSRGLLKEIIGKAIIGGSSIVSGKVRLGIILAMLAMVLAVSVPAMAQDVNECDFDENGFVSDEEADECVDEDVDECDFDEDDFVSDEEADECADALEDSLEDSLGLGADVDAVCVDDDDGDGLLDEDGDNDGEDDDEDGEVDEDDDCDPDDVAYIVTL